MKNCGFVFILGGDGELFEKSGVSVIAYIIKGIEL